MKYILLITFLFNFSFAETWKINTEHSHLDFSIPFLKLSSVKGKFKKYSGELDLRKKSFSIIIKSDSIDTENKVRDGHIREKDFLHSKLFPYISFISSKITGLKDDEFLIEGDLKFKGQVLSRKLAVKISAPVKDTWNYDNLFMSFSTTLSLKELGITWNKTLPENQFILGDKIAFNGVLQFQKSSQFTPKFKFKIPDTGHIRQREKISRGEIAPEKSRVDLSSQPPPSADLIEVSTTKTKKEKITKPAEEEKNSLVSLLSIIYISLISFAAIIILSIFVKRIESDRKYFGLPIAFITDSVCIILILFYAISMNFIWKLY